ncbi:MAG TPA: hypothetical protein PLJ35_04355 [Anaerolineae bacterium]|nr:hypothetical protein [Anaerolineae bacterium]HOQ98035.1 hypothetical protein [Anaerolineae bacterium]HPL29085.1 hypothetical protein [Anaerolineae bacterium]
MVTTTAFSSLARMEAKSFGLPDAALLVVPHPVGAGQTPEMVKIKATNAMAKLVQLMTDRG